MAGALLEVGALSLLEAGAFSGAVAFMRETCTRQDLDNHFGCDVVRVVELFAGREFGGHL